MLRCSNACVRGAGISAERRMAAMRMMSTSSRSRSSSMLMRARVASLLLNPLPELGRQLVPVATWIHNLGIRRMATEASELEPEPEESRNQNRIRDRKGWEDFKVRNNNRYRNETRAQNHDGEAEILLDIAKAATAPRTKREADGIGSAGVVSKKVVDMEIKWLQDPKELADRVARLLKGREPALAVALVRRAQTDGVRCQVAWNHLLHHCMDRDAPQAAFRFYNEMKKRGRKPDDRTYTIMLNGLGHTSKTRGFKPVDTALSIYKSIRSPNITHSNAMLNVCAHHGDMDTLWEVAGNLPEEGFGAPDQRTYTIILHAIKAISQRDVSNINPSRVDDILKRKAAAVREGKKIWSDIVLQWKRGDLHMDRVLVSAMASLLVEGSSERDCYDVLALVNQTMGVPIYAPKPPDVPQGKASALSEEAFNEIKQRASHARNRATESFQTDDSDIPFEGEEGEPLSESQEENLAEEEEEESFEGLFDAVVPETTSNTKNVSPVPSYAELHNSVLTLVLTACRLMTQGIGPAKRYWQYFTEESHERRIQPDSHSFHEYLRLLRVGRSSRLALEIIRDQMIPADAVEGKTFRIALSTCRRDRKNPNVFQIANEMLDLMASQFILPDPNVLETYVRLVDGLASQPLELSSLNGLNVPQSQQKPQNMLANTRTLRFQLQLQAISQLRPHISKLLTAMENSKISKVSSRGRSSSVFRDGSVVGFLALKALVRTRALIDDLLGPQYEAELSKSDRELLEQETKRLRKYSAATMVERFEETKVTPTREQVLQFQQRRLEAEDNMEERDEPEKSGRRDVDTKRKRKNSKETAPQKAEDKQESAREEMEKKQPEDVKQSEQVKSPEESKEESRHTEQENTEEQKGGEEKVTAHEEHALKEQQKEGERSKETKPEVF
ncbi:hypothetical protein DTO271D3_2794 [Paecilomyces variotii]|nr:hypothetical protein DTO271D3_2794 [Paecilomyces variotii]